MNISAAPSTSSRPQGLQTTTSSESLKRGRPGTFAGDITEIQDVLERPAAPLSREAEPTSQGNGCFNALFIKVCEKLFGKTAH